jgi:hypothetical protein
MVISSGNNFILTDDGKDNKGVPIVTEYDIRTDEAAYRQKDLREIDQIQEELLTTIKEVPFSDKDSDTCLSN